MRIEWLKNCKMILNKVVWKIQKNVICEHNSRVYSSCWFEGFNRICRDAYVSNSAFGYGTYVGIGSYIVSTRIGRFTTIGPHVNITSGKHPIDHFASIHPAFYSLRKQAGFTFVKSQKFDEGLDGKKHTSIGNDVWIGDSAIIIEGVNISDGAVVAAGSVVTKDVPPYAIVAGVPARVIRKRFSDEQINSLMIIKWWNRDLKWIKENADMFVDVDALINYCSGEKI